MTVNCNSRHRAIASLKGLYLILDEQWSSRCSLAEVLHEAVQAGVQLVQYRNKTGSMKQAYESAKILREIAKEEAMVFIVNDRCDLAIAVDADGVHLGQTDLPFALARKVVGTEMIIGASTHNSEQVRMAMEEQVDYLGFGPIFPTDTKTNLDPVVGIEGMEQIRGLTTLPIFAIGGVTVESVEKLAKVGANGVAVASGILDAKDRQQAFHQFLRPFR